MNYVSFEASKKKDEDLIKLILIVSLEGIHHRSTGDDERHIDRKSQDVEQV